jgi:hypothetical protein
MLRTDQPPLPLISIVNYDLVDMGSGHDDDPIEEVSHVERAITCIYRRLELKKDQKVPFIHKICMYICDVHFFFLWMTMMPLHI